MSAKCRHRFLLRFLLSYAKLFILIFVAAVEHSVGHDINDAGRQVLQWQQKYKTCIRVRTLASSSLKGVK